MEKRTLSLALALIFCFALALPAFADGETERGVLSYSVVIQPQYEDARQFNDGLAAVKKNGKWGYIDTDNKVVIPFQYDMAWNFAEGKAIVMPEISETFEHSVYDENYTQAGTETVYYGKLGFIDETGKYTPFMVDTYDGSFDWQTYEGTIGELRESHEFEIDAYDDSMFAFSNGYALFWTDYGMSYLFKSDGHTFPAYMLSPDGLMSEGLVPFGGVASGAGWMDENGKIVKYFEDFSAASDRAYRNGDQSYTYISRVLPFQNGLAPVWQCTTTVEGYTSTYKLGFMDRNFNWVIQPQYTNYFYHFRGTRDQILIWDEINTAKVEKDGKYGAIDRQGNVVIPFQYDALWASGNGFTMFQSGGKRGYLSSADNTVAIPAQFDLETGFNDLGVAVVSDGRTAWLINTKGEKIPGSDSLDASTYFVGTSLMTPDEYVVIHQNDKYGYGHIEYKKPLPEPEEMDAWAYEEVCAAIEEELVPGSLQNLYRNNINRSEFCDLVVQAVTEITEKSVKDLVQEKTGKSLRVWQQDYPFMDTSDSDVIAAYALGVINGRGNKVFDPYAGITRQEAAVMLTNAAKLLGADISGSADSGFNDGTVIASWAQDAVDFVFEHNIMNGTGGNAFSPLNPYTREQSYMTIYRLFTDITAE